MLKVKEDLQKKYDGKKIDEIESGIKRDNKLSLESKKKAVFALLYLRNSGRYKENPVYRKSSFKNYLLNYYNIRENTFNESVRAFSLFEKEACKYGVGIISRIDRECGKDKQKQVVAEIVASDKEAKHPIQRAKIDTIIQKYAKPTPPAKPGYKALYVAEVKSHQITKDRYKETLQELKTAKEQIEKLKTTVLELRPLRDMKAAMMPFMILEGQAAESRV